MSRLTTKAYRASEVLGVFRAAHSQALVYLFLTFLLTALGCATVAPYERETLARSDMQFEGAPEIAEGETHATEVREGSAGGFGGTGGGCGCN